MDSSIKSAFKKGLFLCPYDGRIFHWFVLRNKNQRHAFTLPMNLPDLLFIETKR